MRESNIGTAQREYYKRPADERFESLDALIDAKRSEREMSHEAVYNLRDLRTAAVLDYIAPGTSTPTPTIMLESPKGRAHFSHYSFGQLCADVKAPAKYLRSLPPAIAADALNYGMHEAAPHGTKVNVLIKDDPTQPFPTARACTSETYGRVWDESLYGTLRRHFGDGLPTTTGGTWITPPAWPGSPPSGNYAGDRDSFVIRVDGGSIVTDPSAGQGDGSQLYRAILVRNSEVGHCSISIESILYRYICGNHMLWGAILDRQFRRRHVGKRAVNDAMQELATLAYKFANRTASQDEAIIRTLIEHEIATTKEGVIDELQKMGATKEQATEAYTLCMQTEQASPRSFWGISQGLTRYSQQDGYQDERAALDALASRVIAKGAKQYATV